MKRIKGLLYIFVLSVLFCIAPNIVLANDYSSDYLSIKSRNFEANIDDYMDLEEKMKEKKKLEETQEIKISSPYTTDDNSKYKSKSYILLYILVIALVVLAIFWAVKQITVDNKVATMVSTR